MESPCPRAFSRRTFVIAAGSAAFASGLIGMDGIVGARAAMPLRRWRGTVLGADGSIVMAHHDASTADRLLGECLNEVRRLEAILSLYRPDSALSRLNRTGDLHAPPLELVELLSLAATLWRSTGGAFDPTVQTLWTIAARAAVEQKPPRDDAIEGALRRVGFGNVDIATRRIRFARPGMACTLNGIGQGYIADRVADRLREAGRDHVLVDLGEIQSVGGHPRGRPWRVGIDGAPGLVLSLADQAAATSLGAATPLTADGARNHLFHPHTGASPDPRAGVTVTARRAVLADGLSTALALMDPAHDRALEYRFGATIARWLTRDIRD